MRYLRNEQGSTLLLVLITTVVLTALGTTVLTLNYMNYNMKYTDQRLKETLYYSESGLDQIYSRVGMSVDKAIYEAVENTKSDLEYNEEEMYRIFDGVKDIADSIAADALLKEDFYNYYRDHVYDIEADGMSQAEFVERKLFLHIVMNLYDRLDATPAPSPRTLVESVISDLDTRAALDNFTMIDGDDFIQFLVYDPTPGVEELVKITDVGLINHLEYNLLADENEAIQFADSQLAYHYKHYFETNIATIFEDIFDPTAGVDNEFVYLNSDVTSSNSDYVIDKDAITTKMFNANPNPDLLMFENVQSSFVYDDKLMKTISTDIVIDIPSFSSQIGVSAVQYEREDNPLFRYALVTQSDIDFYADATIDGSIYALGNKPEDADYEATKNPFNYDGISIKGSGATVTVDGDVVTQSYVQIASGVSGSTMNMVNSHIYCDSFIIQTGSSNSNLNVFNGNVYAQDDLELNGESSNINIQGSYYGFMGSAKYFNKTSAIVINAPLDGPNASTLTISGQNADVYASEAYDGVMVAGVSFINDEFFPDPYSADGVSGLYNTGESMGIKGNYLAYFYPSSVSNDEVTSSTSGSGLQVYYKKNATDEMTVFDKVTHFMEVKDTIPLNTGNGNINIAQSAYMYALGVVVADNTFWYDSSPDAAIADYGEDNILKDYLFIVNNLRHRESTDTGFELLDTGAGIVNMIDRAKGATVIDSFSQMDEAMAGSTQHFDLDPAEDILTDKLGPQDYMGSDIRGKQVKIVKVSYDHITPSYRDETADHADNFLLLGNNFGLLTDDNGTVVAADGVYEFGGEDYYAINAEAGVIHGIIATVGKVQMLGDLDFYGAILAYDDIVVGPNGSIVPVGGNHDITLVNSDVSVQNYLTRLINQTYTLNTEFRDLDLYGGDELLFDMGTFKYIEEVVLAAGNTDAMRQYYNDYIYFQNWRLED